MIPMRFQASDMGLTPVSPFAANLLRYGRQDLTALWRSLANGIPTSRIFEGA
jgi:hypothetical protein